MDLRNLMRLTSNGSELSICLIAVEVAMSRQIQCVIPRHQIFKVASIRRAAIDPSFAVQPIEMSLAHTVNPGEQGPLVTGKAQHARPFADFPQVAPFLAAFVN